MLYTSEVTDQTLKELVEFISWYNKLGHEPLIVGGWAAYAYHGGLGSKDIDVVFPGGGAMQQTLLQYFKVNGYDERKTSFFDYEFYKTRKTSNGREVEMIIDAVSSDRKVVVNGTALTIPWGLAEKYKRKHYFAQNVHAWIAEPELMVIYKIGALIGRAANLSIATERERLRIEGKLWKDAKDLLGLFEKTPLASNKIAELLYKCGLSDEFLVQAKQNAEDYLSEKEKSAFQEKWKEKLESASLKDGLPKHLKKSARNGL